MSASAQPPGGDAPSDLQPLEHDLPPRARSIGIVAWCSFLAAGAGTTVFFAYLDPAAFPLGEVPSWWQGRHAVYALGFFFFWLLAAGSSALTLYMLRTERPGPGGKG
jgi:hypothetical protein